MWPIANGIRWSIIRSLFHPLNLWDPPHLQSIMLADTGPKIAALVERPNRLSGSLDAIWLEIVLGRAPLEEGNIGTE